MYVLVTWLLNLVVFYAIFDCVLDHGRTNHGILLGLSLQILVMVVAFNRCEVGMRIFGPPFSLHPSQLGTLADVCR